MRRMGLKRFAVVFAVLAGALAGAGTATAATPSNTSPPTITGTPQRGQTLTAHHGTWSGATPLSFAYQWRRCDQNGANCADISGAKSQSYTLVSVDQGNTLRVVVTAKNAAGSSSATSVPSAVVAAPASGTVTMDSSRSIVVYGQSVRLFGAVAGGQAGESVSIIGRPLGRDGLPAATAAT